MRKKLRTVHISDCVSQERFLSPCGCMTLFSTQFRAYSRQLFYRARFRLSRSPGWTSQAESSSSCDSRASRSLLNFPPPKNSPCTVSAFHSPYFLSLLSRSCWFFSFAPFHLLNSSSQNLGPGPANKEGGLLIEEGQERRQRAKMQISFKRRVFY